LLQAGYGWGLLEGLVDDCLILSGAAHQRFLIIIVNF
jgi:hypothetical protein